MEVFDSAFDLPCCRGVFTVMGDATILVRALAFLYRGLSFFTAMAFSDFAMVFEPIGEACREFLSSGGLATWDGLGLQKPRLPAITGRHSSIERYLQSQSTSPSPHGFTAHHGAPEASAFSGLMLSDRRAAPTNKIERVIFQSPYRCL